MKDLFVDRDLWGAIVNERPTVETIITMMSETFGIAVSTTPGTETSKASRGELSAADRAALAKWDNMDRKVKGLICICLEDLILMIVMEQDTTKGI